ncbi:MAG: pitrilysin family protein [Candidatus Harrisonbacteria bacterium]|nr:pitrilysin family protein [Candidatus Harrisonbacteria bacterium]
MSLLYGDQPAGWDIGGRKEVIRAATRQDFIDFRNKHYYPQATTLLLAGNFDEAALVAQAKELFKDMPTGEKSDKLPTRDLQDKPQVLLHEKKVDQAHLVLGYRAFSLFDDRRHTLELLSDILGGGMSSRLFERLREKMGAAYYVSAYGDFYTDHGYIAASAGVELSKTKEAVRAIKEEFERFVSEKVSEEELNRHKSHLTGNVMLSLETSDRLAVFYGLQETLAKKMESTEVLMEKIQAVSAEDIQALAQELFTTKHLNLALLGPFKDQGEFETLLAS